jgi:hypothetical protein
MTQDIFAGWNQYQIHSLEWTLRDSFPGSSRLKIVFIQPLGTDGAWRALYVYELHDREIRGGENFTCHLGENGIEDFQSLS